MVHDNNVPALRFLHSLSLLDWKMLWSPLDWVWWLSEELLPIQRLSLEFPFRLQPFRASWWPPRPPPSNSMNGGQSFGAGITTRKVTACAVIYVPKIMVPIRSFWKM